MGSEWAAGGNASGLTIDPEVLSVRELAARPDRALPEPTLPPRAHGRPDTESIADLVAAGSNVVAVVVGSLALGHELRGALALPGVTVGGAERIATAETVVVDATEDAAAAVAAVRRSARSDAAILAVVRGAASETAACQAGAFACAHVPVVARELRSLLRVALDSRAAKAQTAMLTERLRREERLASIGRMSAGLTHELATPLAVANHSVGMLRVEIEHLANAPRSPALPGLLGELETSLARMTALLASLQPVVRAEPTPLVALALDEVAEEVLRGAADALVDCEIEEVLEPVRAMAQPTLLRRLLHNLIANAGQAARTLPAPRVRLHVYAAGGRAVFSVRDNGPGIPEEFQETIFDPFFTTRREHGGTGLGLALCREYARCMDANLSLWSTPGRGACFRLSLGMG